MGHSIESTNIEEHIGAYKKEGKKITLVGGCFDVIHPGHIAFLSAAQEVSDVLVVMLESDESVRTRKGDTRPIHTQTDRAYVLSHIQGVDTVICLPLLVSDTEYLNIVERINPDFFAITKGDPVKRYIEPQSEKIGATIVEVIDRKNYATTHIAERLKI